MQNQTVDIQLLFWLILFVDVGFEIGEHAKVNYIVVQIHYRRGFTGKICFFSSPSKYIWMYSYLPPAGRVLLSVCHAFIKGCTSHWLFLLGLFHFFHDLIAYVLSFDAVISHLGP